MDPITIRVFVGLLIGGPIVLASEALTRDLRLRWRIRRMRQTPMGSLPRRGLVKVCGTIAAVEAGPVAPLSEESCAYFHLVEEQVEHYYVGGARVEAWTLANEVSDAAESFVVVDESGAVDVVPSNDSTQVLLSPSAYRHQQDGEARAREARLRPGDRVIVIGSVSWEPGRSPERGEAERLYRDPVPVRPVIQGSPRTPLIIELSGEGPEA